MAPYSDYEFTINSIEQSIYATTRSADIRALLAKLPSHAYLEPRRSDSDYRQEVSVVQMGARESIRVSISVEEASVMKICIDYFCHAYNTQVCIGAEFLKIVGMKTDTLGTAMTPLKNTAIERSWR